MSYRIRPRISKKKQTSFLIISVLVFLIFVPIKTDSSAKEVSLHHRIQNEIAYRYQNAPNFTKLLNYYQLEARYDYSRDLAFTAIGRLSYDAIYDTQSLSSTNPFQDRFQSTEPREFPDIDAFDADFRELYADIYFDRVDLRLGKQITRWGVIEGFRITDELNPQDFSEFILRELSDKYIPIWMAKADIYFENAALQVIWIPELVFNRPAASGTEWEEFQLPPGLDRPPRTFKNTEFGLRLTTYQLGFDLAFSYLDSWDDFPTASRTIFGLNSGLSARSADFVPRYHRLHLLGFSFSKTAGAHILKGEVAYVFGKNFGTLPDDQDGDDISDIEELERQHIKYGIGIDTRLPGHIETFIQFSQQIIVDYNNLIIADQVESGASLLIRREFLHKRLLFRVLTLYMLNDKEAMIRPRLSYQWNDGLKISFGVDLFEGTPGRVNEDDLHFIGFFDENDRIYTEIRYQF